MMKLFWVLGVIALACTGTVHAQVDKDCVRVSTAKELQEAVTQSKFHCIEVASGRYFTIGELNITRNLRIEGMTDDVVLDGSKNGGFVVLSVAADVTATVSRLGITGGVNQVVPYPTNCASGVRNLGILTLQDCHVYGNTNSEYGGGVANIHGTLTISNCNISDNDSQTEGGGLYTEFGTVKILNSTISYNRGRAGGGIASLSSVTLINSTVHDNLAFGELLNNEGEGGGIWNTCHMVEDPGQLLTLVNSSVYNNTAALGGGISVFAGKAILEGTAVSGNSAFKDPGIRVHQYFHDGVRQTDSSLELRGVSVMYDNVLRSQ